MKEIHNALKDQPDIIAKMHLTKNKWSDLPIHWATLEKMQEIHKVLKDQPEVIAKMYLTQNKHGKLPLNYSSQKEIAKEVHRAIINAALNSDLDVETSIKLLTEYNNDNRYSTAIEELKKKQLY